MKNKKIATKLAAMAAIAMLCCCMMFVGKSANAQTVSCDSCTVPTDNANNVGGTASVP